MIKNNIKELLNKAIIKAGYKIPDNFDVDYPRDEEYGDYSSNIVMILAKTEKKNPTEIANKILDNFRFDGLQAEFNNGFINFKLDNNYFLEAISKILDEQEKYGHSQISKSKKIIVEYSQPNVNKTMHIGHARNDYLGMAVSRILEATGDKVIKANYFNDRGIAIAKAMLMYNKNHTGGTPESKNIRSDYFVSNIYAEYEKEIKTDPSLEEQAQEYLRKWEAGDPEILKLWQKITQWAYEGFAKTYDREGSKFDLEFHESEIYKSGKTVVEKYLKKGIFQKAKDGHIYVDLTKYGLDQKVLIRADGTAIYITSDLVLAEKKNDLKIDKSIYVVDIYQSYHFQVLFKIFELLDYKWAKKCYHLGYGYVFLKGEKMSSRKGNIIPTDQLIDDLKSKISKIMDKVVKQKVTSSKQKDEIAEQLALGAIKYGMLKYEEQKDIHFDPEETIKLEGETGPYLQYTYARIQGILDKVESRKLKVESFGKINISKVERDLMVELTRFPEIILKSSEELKPHYLCNYLYNVTKSFNTFYNALSVLKAETEELKNFRLNLCQASAIVLKNGLTILGISAPEKI